jgi:carboxypeptidase D
VQRRSLCLAVVALAVTPCLVVAADGFRQQDLQRQPRASRSEVAVPVPQLVEETAPDGRVFTGVKVPGSGHGVEVGRPDLPTLVEDFEVAPRGRVSVRVVGQGSRRLATPHWVYPVQEPLPKLPGARERRRFAFDEGWYRGGRRAAAAVPEVSFSTATYVVRGQRFVRVTVSPYSYDPAGKELSYPATVFLDVAVADPSLPAAAGPRPGPVLILRVPCESRAELAVLQALGADIKTVRGNEAIVYARDDERLAFEQAGFAVEIIEVQTPDAEGTASKAISAGYHDWSQVQALMTAFSADYPTLCRLETIGVSVGGRPILALCISDNPATEEAEPEVRLVGAIHGDEVLGTEMSLLFIDHLLSGYATDSRLRSLVDTTEIWVVPVMNPDGFVSGSRYNATGVDLNRSFPEGSLTPIGNVFTGPPMDTAGRPAETVAMMQWSAARSFVLSATFHTGALVANYPYDNDGLGSVYSPTTDEDVFYWLAEMYSSRNPPMWASTVFPHGITNGAAWYAVQGGLQDWLYRYLGCMDLTLEISTSDRPAADTLPTQWANNREAMLAYCEAAHTGLRGVVTAAGKGGPLRASIAVQGRTAPVFSDPDLGDYYRLLRPGTYTVTVSAPGHIAKTVPGVTVTAGGATVLDVSLEASAGAGAPMIVVHHADHDVSFEAYRSQKQSEGYTVTPVRLTGSPSAETVRSQVREAYAGSAARYVVILGDVEKVPTFVNTAYGTTARSDLAYALLDPGETFDDFLGKDVGIGRIALDSNAELLEYIAKLAAFSAGPRHRDLTWVSGGSSTWENDVAEGTHNYVIANYIDPARYRHELFYRTNGSAAELSAHITSGTDAVVYSGHGSVTGWLRYDYDGADLAGLTNTLDAPVVFGHCCLTGSFQVDDCFAEEWLATKERGVVYVGGSQNTLWDEDDVLERREFQYFDEHPGSSIADALDWGLRQTATAYPATAEYYFTIYHIFGDPTVRPFGLPLEVIHTPLADTIHRAGPYVVDASVTAETAPQSVELHWRTLPGGAFTAVPMATVGGTAYQAQIPGQGYGTEVQYYIVATTATGISAAHPEAAPTVLNAFRVDVQFTHAPLGNTTDTVGPYGVEAGVAADTEVSVMLNWRVGEDAYTALPLALVGSLYSASIPGQPAGTTVSYYLSATDATRYVAYEPAGAPASTHRFVIDSQPPVFAGLDLAQADDRRVTLSWLAAEDASLPVTYSVFRATSPGAQDFGAPLATTQGLVYSDTGLANSKEYFYVVRAADALGNGESNSVERSAIPRGPEPIYTWSLDTDPGWSRDSAWAYGVPQGRGGEYGGPDPTAGATGTAVFGYNLAGDYSNNMSARYLTTHPIDCGAITGVSLRFQRWLNVEQPAYDQATIEVSTDGSTWQQVWQNPAEITDGAWTLQTLDVSTHADGCATLRVRWGMGPTDSSWRYSGWNLDDIQIWGVPVTPPSYLLTLDAMPPAGGTVEASPAPGSDGRYAEGAVVTLTPVPAQGYAFTGWSGDAGGTEWPVEVAMTTDRTVGAHFAWDDVTPPEFAGLTAASAVAGQVALSWGAATDASLPISYQVYRAQVAGGQDYDSPLATTPDLGYTDHTVVNGSTYYYVVRAVDAVGNRDGNLVERAARVREMVCAFSWPLDTNPRWDRSRSWAFGIPRGSGARQGGFPDPLGGHTGTHVLGYNLRGDYGNGMRTAAHLTTPALDCSALVGAELRYRRWLNVESLPADRAAIEISTDGVTWHTVWQNDNAVTDSSWRFQAVDISAYADGCPTLSLRWAMGPTNRTVRMSGWNLDDIEIWGEVAGQRSAAASPSPVVAKEAECIAPSAQARASGWSWSLEFRGGIDTTLVFGLASVPHTLSTSSALAAPAAWFIGDDGTACQEQILAETARGEWLVDVVPSLTMPAHLSWSEPTGFPAGRFVTLTEVDTGGETVAGGLAADLRRDTELTLPTGAPRRLRVRSAPEISWELLLALGWNPISLPLEPALPSAAMLFADSADGSAQALPVLRYDTATGIYVPTESIRACEGYWVYAARPLRIAVVGALADAGTLRLAAGWNLIGVPFALAGLPGARQGVGPWFACTAADSALVPAASLSPGTAYWVFSPVPITLNLDEAAE